MKMNEMIVRIRGTRVKRMVRGFILVKRSNNARGQKIVQVEDVRLIPWYSNIRKSIYHA